MRPRFLHRPLRILSPMTYGATSTGYGAGVPHVCGRDCACGTGADRIRSRRCPNNQTESTRLIDKLLRRVGVRVA